MKHFVATNADDRFPISQYSCICFFFYGPFHLCCCGLQLFPHFSRNNDMLHKYQSSHLFRWLCARFSLCSKKAVYKNQAHLFLLVAVLTPILTCLFRNNINLPVSGAFFLLFRWRSHPFRFSAVERCHVLPSSVDQHFTAPMFFSAFTHRTLARTVVWILFQLRSALAGSQFQVVSSSSDGKWSDTVVQPYYWRVAAALSTPCSGANTPSSRSFQLRTQRTSHTLSLRAKSCMTLLCNKLNIVLCVKTHLRKFITRTWVVNLAIMPDQHTLQVMSPTSV